MNFLAPFFLLGALAIAAPVIFHLIRRTTREKTTFSSLMFLLPTPPRLTKRSRLEHILLLLLRCLVLCLLALGFARPFIQRTVDNPQPTGPGRKIAVVVDTSASMRRTNLWNDAVSKARDVLQKTTPVDQVAVYVFDRSVKRVVSFEEWNGMNPGERAAVAGQRLAAETPGWYGTQLGNSLVTISEALDDSNAADKQALAIRKQIVLISDLQEGSRPDRLQAYEWPKGVELVVEPVKARRAGNAGLQLVADVEDTEKKPGAYTQRVRVSNTSDARSEQFQVGWALPGEEKFAGAAVDVYVPPGQSRVVSVPGMPAGADHILLRGDDETFDNSAYVVPMEAMRANILYLGKDAEKDSGQPLYYLKRAFQATRKQIVAVTARTMSEPLLATETATPLIIVSDALPDGHVEPLRGLLNQGQNILYVMKDVGAAASIARLLQLPQIAAEEVVAGGNRYAMMGEINFQHPLFAPFADPRFSDFTKIHFWKHRKLDADAIPNARVVAKFDSGDPALVQVPVGKGSLLILTAGWQPSDSQLALSTKFVPLLYSLLEMGGGGPARSAQYYVGDAIPLAGNDGDAKPTVRLPDGKVVTLTNATALAQTDLPGIYQITTAKGVQRFAVNVDVMESRSNPLAIDDLERLGAPIKLPAADPAQQLKSKKAVQSSELESQQKMWRWLILAALLALLGETALSGWFARRTQPAAAS